MQELVVEREAPEAAQVLTVRQVAALLNMHPNTVRRLRQQGKLPGTHIGQQLRFPRQAIERLAQGVPMER